MGEARADLEHAASALQAFRQSVFGDGRLYGEAGHRQLFARHEALLEKLGVVIGQLGKGAAGNPVQNQEALGTVYGNEPEAQSLRAELASHRERDFYENAKRLIDASRDMLLATGGTPVAMIALIAAVTILTRRQIVRPIDRLSLAASQVAAGNLELPIEVSNRDEIGDLQAAFNPRNGS